LGVILGLFTAFVSACLMTVGVLGLNLAFGGGIDLPFMWQMSGQIINGGGLAALLAGLSAWLLANAIRWLIRRSRRISLGKQPAREGLHPAEGA
jgi:hypothetical protein